MPHGCRFDSRVHLRVYSVVACFLVLHSAWELVDITSEIDPAHRSDGAGFLASLRPSDWPNVARITQPLWVPVHACGFLPSASASAAATPALVFGTDNCEIAGVGCSALRGLKGHMPCGPRPAALTRAFLEWWFPPALPTLSSSSPLATTSLASSSLVTAAPRWHNGSHPCAYDEGEERRRHTRYPLVPSPLRSSPLPVLALGKGHAQTRGAGERRKVLEAASLSHELRARQRGDGGTCTVTLRTEVLLPEGHKLQEFRQQRASSSVSTASSSASASASLSASIAASTASTTASSATAAAENSLAPSLAPTLATNTTSCLLGQSFGCYADDGPSLMWVSPPCRGTFLCNGVRSGICGRLRKRKAGKLLPLSGRVNCSCDADPKRKAAANARFFADASRRAVEEEESNVWPGVGVVANREWVMCTTGPSEGVWNRAVDLVNATRRAIASSSAYAATLRVHPWLLWDCGGPKLNRTLARIAAATPPLSVTVCYVVDDYELSLYADSHRRLYVVRTSIRRSLASADETVLPFLFDPLPQIAPPLRKAGHAAPAVGFVGRWNAHRSPLLELLSAAETSPARSVSTRFEQQQSKVWATWLPEDARAAAAQAFRSSVEDTHFTVTTRGRGNFAMRFYQVQPPALGRLQGLTTAPRILAYLGRSSTHITLTEHIHCALPYQLPDPAPPHHASGALCGAHPGSDRHRHAAASGSRYPMERVRVARVNSTARSRADLGRLEGRRRD